MNPLEKPGQAFHLDLRNPNPRSSKSKDGPVYRISFEVDQETFLAFMDARTPGMYLACAATVIVGVEGAAPAPATESASAKPFGEQAETLHKSRVFGLVEFASAVGTDAEYHAWIQRQKSCVSHQYSEYVDGEGRCIAAHVRRASDAGTAFKPEFHQVPLTDSEHQLQHASGENEVLRRAGILDARADAGIAGKDWFYEKAFSYRHRWVWETLKGHLGYSSWSLIPPHVLAEWCASKSPSLLAKLPRCYRDAKR